MLSCKENSKLVSAQYDRELGLRERIGLRMHLLMCKYCKLAARQIATIQKLVGMDIGQAMAEHGDAHLTSEARERMEISIREATRNGPDSGQDHS